MLESSKQWIKKLEEKRNELDVNASLSDTTHNGSVTDDKYIYTVAFYLSDRQG